MRYTTVSHAAPRICHAPRTPGISIGGYAMHHAPHARETSHAAALAAAGVLPRSPTRMLPPSGARPLNLSVSHAVSLLVARATRAMDAPEERAA
jgi:hypothetical protein